MYPQGGREWVNEDVRLTAEAQILVDEHWDAIRALAQAILAKPVGPRSRERFQKWCSPYPNARRIDGHESLRS